MNRYVAAVLLGAAAGMRTSVAPLAARRLTSQGVSISGVMGFLAEAALDKMPFIGPRTAPGPLLARAGAAAYAARSLHVKQKIETVPLLALAAACAVCMAFGASRLRAAVVRETGWPDAAVALAEDVAALGLAFAAVGF